jgi:hypothetical protein
MTKYVVTGRRCAHVYLTVIDVEDGQDPEAVAWGDPNVKQALYDEEFDGLLHCEKIVEE